MSPGRFELGAAGGAGAGAPNMTLQFRHIKFQAANKGISIRGKRLGHTI